MLFRALSQPPLLAFFLQRTSWEDFHALVNTSRELRNNLWLNQDCRDVILCHFLPGYSYALEMYTLEQQKSDVRVDFHQLSLLSTFPASSATPV